jgi:hypothetical protein
MTKSINPAKASAVVAAAEVTGGTQEVPPEVPEPVVAVAGAQSAALQTQPAPTETFKAPEIEALVGDPFAKQKILAEALGVKACFEVESSTPGTKGRTLRTDY